MFSVLDYEQCYCEDYPGTGRPKRLYHDDALEFYRLHGRVGMNG